KRGRPITIARIYNRTRRQSDASESVVRIASVEYTSLNKSTTTVTMDMLHHKISTERVTPLAGSRADRGPCTQPVSRGENSANNAAPQDARAPRAAARHAGCPTCGRAFPESPALDRKSVV